MVVKLMELIIPAVSPFESSVISYGCQTPFVYQQKLGWFESSVISYGCQTLPIVFANAFAFESSVISYGCQTTSSR